jgi:hypothetical protein
LFPDSGRYLRNSGAPLPPSHHREAIINNRYFEFFALTRLIDNDGRKGPDFINAIASLALRLHRPIEYYLASPVHSIPRRLHHSTPSNSTLQLRLIDVENRRSFFQSSTIIRTVNEHSVQVKLVKPSNQSPAHQIGYTSIVRGRRRSPILI